jgi:hypothetical protein
MTLMTGIFLKSFDVQRFANACFIKREVSNFEARRDSFNFILNMPTKESADPLMKCARKGSSGKIRRCLCTSGLTKTQTPVVQTKKLGEKTKLMPSVRFSLLLSEIIIPKKKCTAQPCNAFGNSAFYLFMLVREKIASVCYLELKRPIQEITEKCLSQRL